MSEAINIFWVYECLISSRLNECDIDRNILLMCSLAVLCEVI